MMFAILFGLSMDYEVFLISRIREEYLKDGDTRRAVADGLAKTARVITAAAAIMVVVFLAFLAAPDTFLKLFGIGLGVGDLPRRDRRADGATLAALRVFGDMSPSALSLSSPRGAARRRDHRLRGGLRRGCAGGPGGHRRLAVMVVQRARARGLEVRPPLDDFRAVARARVTVRADWRRLDAPAGGSLPDAGRRRTATVGDLTVTSRPGNRQRAQGRGRGPAGSPAPRCTSDRRRPPARQRSGWCGTVTGGIVARRIRAAISTRRVGHRTCTGGRGRPRRGLSRDG